MVEPLPSFQDRLVSATALLRDAEKELFAGWRTETKPDYYQAASVEEARKAIIRALGCLSAAGR